MERRIGPRVPLDPPVFVAILLESGESCTAQLVNCSRYGLQLAFPPGEDIASSLLKQRMTIMGLPEKLNVDPEGCPGEIIWVSPHRCGVRLDTPLNVTEELLLTLADTL